jgi:uridine phosphorylase
MTGKIAGTDLILNKNGSIYHLQLKPGELAGTIILVGDPARVGQVSSHFDTIEVERKNREFLSRTGTYHGKRLSVLSTGIGPDNMEIVLNELDALFNIDLDSREIKQDRKCLELIRIGTSGLIHRDIAPGSMILTEVAGGLDGIYHFYRDEHQHNLREISEAFIRHTGWNPPLPEPYFIRASENLTDRLFNSGWFKGITLSTPGFYGPQNRSLRLSPHDAVLLEKIRTFRYDRMRIHNFEMECSVLYALSSMMGHEAVTVCAGIANRETKIMLEEYKSSVDTLIDEVLKKLVTHEPSQSQGT